jgi:ribosome-binding factor A
MGERLHKVNEQIKKEVGSYILEHLNFKGGLFTITVVEASPDLRHARIWFGYTGSDLGSVLSELRRHSGDIQRDLNSKLTMKFVPKISFTVDQSGDYAQKISKIIDQSL